MRRPRLTSPLADRTEDYTGLLAGLQMMECVILSLIAVQADVVALVGLVIGCGDQTMIRSHVEKRSLESKSIGLGASLMTEGSLMRLLIATVTMI